MNTVIDYLTGLSRWHHRSNKVPLHREEQCRPFFIVGSGRCGSTLLRRILVHTSGVTIPPESYVIPRIASLYKKKKVQTWRGIVNFVVASFANDPEFICWNIDLGPLKKSLYRLPPHERSIAYAVNAVYDTYGRSQPQGHFRWGDKTPAYVNHLQALQSIFPKAYFIHLLRDGTDVVNSMMNMTGFDYTIEKAAKRWARSLNSFSQFSSQFPHSCFELRYEHLLRQPSSSLNELCTFLSLKCDVSRIDSVDHINEMPDVTTYDHYANVNMPLSGKHIGKGRKSLTWKERAELQEIIGEQLVSLGYASPLASPPLP